MNMTGFLAIFAGLSILNDCPAAALTSAGSNIEAFLARRRSVLPGSASLCMLPSKDIFWLFIVVS
jgi:hypothetical protein